MEETQEDLVTWKVVSETFDRFLYIVFSTALALITLAVLLVFVFNDEISRVMMAEGIGANS